MDRRYSERISAGYKAEIIYHDSSYAGTIENISSSGVNILTDELMPGLEFQTDEPIELKVLSRTGETVLLKCTIMWAAKIPPRNIRHRIGMEIDGSFRSMVDLL